MQTDLRRFAHSTSGSFMAMAGLTFGLIFLAAGAAIDLSAAMETESKAQRLLDRATLIAARVYRDTEDEAAAIEQAEEMFALGAQNVRNAGSISAFNVTRDPQTKEITANGTASFTVKTYMMHILRPGSTKLEIASEASVTEEAQDLYLVLLIDSTGSMQPLIDSVKGAALDLETEIRSSLFARGIAINRLFVKATFFGDLRLDASPNGWIESPVYNLGDTTETTNFRNFVGAQVTYDGYDMAESSPAAIAHVLTSPLPAALDPAKTVQAVVLWTDAPGLPLSHASISDDITVNLYKTHGEQGISSGYDAEAFNIVTGYDEDALFDGDATGHDGPSPPAYGCCSSLAVLEDRWRSWGTVALDRRLLGLIVPSSEEPWTEMATWPNVTVKDYATPTAQGIIGDVLESLGDRYSPLAITN